MNPFFTMETVAERNGTVLTEQALRVLVGIFLYHTPPINLRTRQKKNNNRGTSEKESKKQLITLAVMNCSMLCMISPEILILGCIAILVLPVVFGTLALDRLLLLKYFSVAP